MEYAYYILAYLVGSINFAYFIGRLRGIDISKFGDSNLGATNLYFAVRHYRKGNPLFYYILSGGLDILKTVIVTYFFGPIAGAFSVVGHTFSVFTFPLTKRIPTGSGFASSIGWLIVTDVRWLLIGLAFVPIFYLLFKDFYTQERGHIFLVFIFPFVGWACTLLWPQETDAITGFLIITIAVVFANMLKIRQFLKSFLKR
ncbi:MAG: glycerol-3-phosphate acyltransferase [Candidatus Aenigmarchaeota archaeon]|nr:glycerol-3-phosphate acyltransferase [Candidatus Aenigmarchaeota archaeon]